MQHKSFNNKIAAVLGELESYVRDSGNAIATQGVIDGTYSQESLGAMRAGLETETAHLRQTLGEMFKDIDDELSQEALAGGEMSEPMRAAMIAAVASSAPEKYHRQAIHGRGEGMSLESLFRGAGGAVEVAEGDYYSQESFDNSELNNFAAQNIVYNVLAARQDRFAEAFFPTKVVAPSEGGIAITVDRQEVIEYKTHPTDGTQLSQTRKNLVDAFADSTILSTPSTELVPYARADNTADAAFVATTDVATTNVSIAGETIPTRPLLMGASVNLLGLSQHPGLIDNGTLDITDQIAAGMRLKKVYMKMTVAGTPDVIYAYAFKVDSMNRSQFKKSAEGSGREVTLNFNQQLVLDSDALTVDGQSISTPLTTLDGIAIGSVILAFSVTGTANLDTGAIELNASNIRVVEARDPAGDVVDASSFETELLTTRGASLIGYEVAGRRSNTNFRTTGSLIDVTPYKESYAIEPGYPLSVVSPADDTNANAAKISGMVNAARVRNSNNAVTTLINYAAQLADAKSALDAGVAVDLIGAGRHIVKPFYGTNTIDVNAQITSISSHERAMDAAAVLVSAIRDMAYKMYRDSNYGPALEMASAGTNRKPKLLIGCDAVVERYLNLVGDDRLLGSEMDYEIVSSNDSRLEGDIYLTFVTGRPGSEDGLSFGVHAFVPELIQRVTTTRGGSTQRNDRVVPRSIHVPVLPVLAKLSVTNLTIGVLNQ